MWTNVRGAEGSPSVAIVSNHLLVTSTIALYEGSAEMIIEEPEWITVP